MNRDIRPQALLIDSALAHALRFEAPLAPGYGNAAGLRILVAFVVVSVGMFFAVPHVSDAFGVRGTPVANFVYVGVLLAAFFLMQRLFVRMPVADVGLRGFAAWTRRERLYFLQVPPLAALLFAIVFRSHLLALLEQRGLPAALLSMLTGLIWGIVQELLYRGWLQTELTRRFGSKAGLLAANVAFTFGPLHLDYLLEPGGMRWGGLIAIFAIGLFFGVLYSRSGNVSIPAVLHGLWPLNMT